MGCCGRTYEVNRERGLNHERKVVVFYFLSLGTIVFILAGCIVYLSLQLKDVKSQPYDRASFIESARNQSAVAVEKYEQNKQLHQQQDNNSLQELRQNMKKIKTSTENSITTTNQETTQHVKANGDDVDVLVGGIRQNLLRPQAEDVIANK